MEDLLRVSSLAVSYNGKRVLSDLTFSLKPGEVLGIVGKSGSGKSTILRAILGILGSGGAVNGGEIFFSGSSLLEMDEKQMGEIRGAQIGMIFQDAGASLCPVRRVGSQMWESMAAMRRSQRNRRESGRWNFWKIWGFRRRNGSGTAIPLNCPAE